jgi:tetratricopeptide (TPR) repeat protein/DNA-binding SARP family transcriptional activator
MGVEFGLLGDVEVRVDGRLVDVGHARQRCVLVVLVVEANHRVSVNALVERVWGDRAPQRARETLYTYLSRLRRALGPITDVDLVRQRGGYVLTLDPLMVDVHRFHHLAAQARAANDEDRALVLFEQSLGLWRGEPFAGLDTLWVNTLRDALERERFAVELDRTDLQLRRGQHGWLLGELATRAKTHPLDERVAGQLMLALYQCGRQAEALEHFQQLRVRLVEELGIDPSPELQRRFKQILTTDPALTAPPTTPPASVSVSTPRLVPRQLPAYTPQFVGRAAELRQLTTLLETTTTGGGTVVITAIDGTAGIGKTALALHWAHQAAERFADGQLYVNLRGFDPTNTPVHPAEALRGFLDAFGISPERIPTSLEAQAGLYRSLLTNRHMLVVLDNARDAEQVRPLLPASPSCLVVITSRNQLASLIAQQGAHPLTLDVLNPQEAHALLTGHLGPDRISAEPGAVTELIEYCAGLPLALAIVAARAATHPGFPLRVLAQELADEHTRLAALDTGEAVTSVQAVFSWSYHHLSPPAARMFRLLGLHPGPDIALPAAAHLSGLPLHQAREALSELTRTRLLTHHTPGRFTFHDLLRAYATHLTTTHDPPEDHHAALTRLFDYYLHTAVAAMNTLRPTNQHHQTHIPPPATPIPPVADPTIAQHWLDTERANLAAIIAHTAAHGWYTHTTQLANTVLLRHLDLGVRYFDTLAIYTHVQHAARHTNDQATEARALTYLGLVHWQQGRYQQAIDHLQRALTISRDTRDRDVEARALTYLGFVRWYQGGYRQAIDHHQQALTISRDTRDRDVEALALTGLGLVHGQQGRYQQAIDHHQQALIISRDTGYRTIEALALTGLGLANGHQGRYQQAIDHHQQALTISRDIGYRFVEALALTSLGFVRWYQGRYRKAIDYHQQALTISRDTRDRDVEALALTGLGLVHGEQGRYQQAIDHHQQALTISRDTGYRTGEARALTGLGLIHRRQGRHQQAIDHHEQALAICRDTRDRTTEAHALTGLGFVHGEQGRYQQAIDYHQQGLTISRDTGYRTGEARALTGLGLIHRRQGRYQQAIDHHEQALAICRDIGNRTNKARILNCLGEAHHANGQLDQARTQHTAALTLATEIGDRYEQAHAHHGLAHTHHTTGDLDQAHYHWQQALTLYTDLGVPPGSTSASPATGEYPPTTTAPNATSA